MKGILREKWNSESGSAQIIEMTLIFPIVLFVLGFLIYVGSYVLQSTAMYTEAQKIAVIAAREGQMPGYENFFAGTGITTKTDFDWSDGYMPGKEVVILGSGDIGLIMARRMTLEGAHVKMVCELMPYSSGLTRNIVQCLNDFDIPLKLSTTVIDIHGKERLEGVTIAKVDENRRPIPGTEEYVPCDTLMLSVGLIPENELSKNMGIEFDRVTGGPIVDEYRETTHPGVFACGNVLHVHDLVDFVTLESQTAGEGAARYIKNGGNKEKKYVKTRGINGVRYSVPQKIALGEDEDVKLFFESAMFTRMPRSLSPTTARHSSARSARDSLPVRWRTSSSRATCSRTLMRTA